MKYELVNEMCEPYRPNSSDAGMDLRSGIELLLTPQVEATIPLGIKTEIPEGYCALLIPRSGIGSRGLELMNTVGVIDSRWRKEWLAKVINKSDHNTLKIDLGDRIIQCVIVPVYLAPWYKGVVTDNTDRGEGFGSSGKI